VAVKPGSTALTLMALSRALLDVNVLIALLDSNHTSHGIAINWLTQQDCESDPLPRMCLFCVLMGGQRSSCPPILVAWIIGRKR
jgi:hypothetical protein